MKLCVSCKGCRRECPTGVDMAKMKIEVLAAANKRRGLSLRDRLVAYMPRYAPYAARLAPLMNLRNGVPVLAALMERATGFSAKRPLPRWRRDHFRANVGIPPTPNPSPQGGGKFGRSLPPRGGGTGGGESRPLSSATSPCSPIPSTPTSNRKTCMPRSPCSRASAIA